MSHVCRRRVNPWMALYIIVGFLVVSASKLAEASGVHATVLKT